MTIYLLIIGTITWASALLVLLSFASVYLTKLHLSNRFERSRQLKEAAITPDMWAKLHLAQILSQSSEISGYDSPAEKIIKDMIKASGKHPEVLEIDPSEQLMGVLFSTDQYPPGFSEE